MEDRKPKIFDGTTSVNGKHDGEVSGASYEPGPWVWEGAAGEWQRDLHPHEVLVSTPCGHAYSEAFWSDVVSTAIDKVIAYQSFSHVWLAQLALELVHTIEIKH